MVLVQRPRALYAAFDRFPTRKGASTHIARFAPALFEEYGGGLLYVVGDDTLPAHQLEICHFRDPWSGVPILERPHRYATVFEVNALPSIELPYAYPSIAPRTIEKIRASERYCLDAADRIVTPSRTTCDLLVGEGVPASKIDVVPNGADPVPPLPRPFEAPDEYLIYFGALQPWQGIDTLLHAFARLADLETLRLVVCGSGRSRHARAAEKLAAKLGLDGRVIWRWELPSSELEPWLSNAILSVAPLRACSRNVEQGCAPLKILESLAAATSSFTNPISEDEPRSLIELLRPIAEYDRLSDKARIPMGCSTAAFFVLSFALFVVAANVSFFLLPLSLAALGLAVFLLVTFKRLRKLDLSNNFRQVAMPLFAVLKEDMETGATMNVRLDLSPPIAKAKKTGTGKPYVDGVYYKVVDTTFVDPWFGGGTRLVDGSLLQWDVTNLPADEGEKVKVRESEKRTTFRLAKRVKSKSIDPIDPLEIFDIISEAYKRVRPAVATGGAS